jgi:hypothetical protein
MLFNPRNTGNKTPVITYDLNEVFYRLCTFNLFFPFLTLKSFYVLFAFYRMVVLSSC